MRGLILALFLSICGGVSAQWTFTREQLEAAADSALKGMEAAETLPQLRKAGQAYLEAIRKYERAQANSDSTMAAQGQLWAADKKDLKECRSENAQKDQTIKRNKGWALFGKAVAVVGSVAVVVAVALRVSKEVAP